MTNAERFLGRVEEYARYRMRFPAEVLDVLREHGALKAGDRIADVGAGTGMLAELFLAAGHEVVAIEPNAEMRAACRLLTGLTALDATAEATGLAARSVDVVAVGRAFHWFDRELALREFERILGPGGWVVLAAVRRDQECSRAMRDYERVLREHGTDYEALHGVDRRSDGVSPWGGAGFRVRTPGEQRLTLEELAGQTQSYSVAPRAGEAGYAGMQEALREYFARWSEGGAVRMETVCEVVGWQVSVLR